MKKLIRLFLKRLKNLKRWVARAPNAAAIIGVKAYQLTLSFFLGGNCRFYPSCSEYSKECFETLPFWNALGLSLRRLSACHPFSRYGYDPVPDKRVEVLK